ncbi:MAG: IreB family regulatory phosphoprotein [Clostridia bacterium]|nr:IreB family regulatory phosphoprotein [Clostridia bacterium]
MEDQGGKTTRYNASRVELTPREVLMTVYAAMKEKGYDPVDQIVGYLLSGDPTYITSHNNARYLILRVERDELLEELVRFYVRRRKPEE